MKKTMKKDMKMKAAPRMKEKDFVGMDSLKKQKHSEPCMTNNKKSIG